MKFSTRTIIVATVFLAYAAVLVKIMVFKDVPMISAGGIMLNFGGTHEGKGNFIPFKTILPYLLGEKGLVIGGLNIVGNIVLLVPVGFLLPFIFQQINSWQCLFVAIASGLIIELMQVLLHVGIFDIDDVILNGLGVMTGYWLTKTFERRQPVKMIMILLIGVALAVCGWYVLAAGEKSGFPVDFRPVADVKTDTTENIIPQGIDPCGGTGGTGKITNIGKNMIEIKGRNGIAQEIFLTDQTILRNATRKLSLLDVKIGQGVTVVVGEKKIAIAILVCNETMVQTP